MSALSAARPGAFFEHVMPPVTTVQLVRYAGASDDYNRIHYDQAYATDEAGLGGVIARGLLTMAFMGSAVTAWAGPRALIRHLDARFTAPVRPGDVVTVVATVTDATPHRVDVRLTARVGAHPTARVVAEGSALVEPRS